MDDQKIFEFGDLRVKPDFLQGWKKEFEDMHPIFVNKEGEDEYLSFSLDEAKFIVESFNEIIEHYKNIPKVEKGMFVEITHGLFKGCRGGVIDIDSCDNERPVMVRINTLDFEGHCYVGYDDVEEIL